MTKEEKLKDYILTRYHSLREFTIAVDMPYSTVSSVLKRGVDKSSIGNVVKICRALGISADALADGEIVPMITRIESTVDDTTEINDILSDTKEILNRRSNLTIDGEPIERENIAPILDAMDVGIELVKRKKNQQKP